MGILHKHIYLHKFGFFGFLSDLYDFKISLSTTVYLFVTYI